MKHIKLMALCACMLALVLCLCAGTALAEDAGSRVLMAGSKYDAGTET